MLLITDLSPGLQAHVWVALKAHQRRLRNDAVPVPRELAELTEALNPSRDERDSEDPLARARRLAAQRQARRRARVRRDSGRQLAS